MSDTFTGPMGTADRIPASPRATEAVTSWLITSPQWAPMISLGCAWTQWLLGCVRLREVPGMAPPKLHFQGATHEVLVMSLNPEGGPYTAAGFWDSPVRWLEPQNVVVQVIATDDEMREVTDLAAHAVVDGVYCPESWRCAGGNRTLTEAWLAGITKTLAHIRGEVHAP